MAAVGQDLAYAFRRLSKSPGFAAAAVVSIGLGIAANSTIFSMVSRFVLTPAPVGDPGTLVALHTAHEGDTCCNQFPWPLLRDVREQTKSFSGVAGYYELVPASIGGNGEPERVWGQAATSNFFDVAQLGMTLGRGFSSREENLPVIVLSNGLWRRRFGADLGIIGRPVLLSGRPFTVVGVAQPSFHGVDLVLDSQFWVPLGNVEQLAPNVPPRDSRDYHWLAAIARIKPGVTREEAAAELNVLARRLAEAYPATDKGNSFRFETAGLLNPRDRSDVLMFLGALSLIVLLVLGIACANVANLLLAQASARQREMAVRLAVGASRTRLMSQLLTESVVLALAGGLFGVLLSLWATEALSTFRTPAPIPLNLAIRVDWRVLLYTFALSVGTGLLFGLVPAWAAARPILGNALKGEEVLSRPGRFWNVRNVLVVSQVAMSLVLLCATGLFLRSLESASHINIGFRSNGVLMMAVDPRVHGYTAGRTVQFFTQLRERVAALPGVASAVATDTVPLSMGGRRDPFHAEGRPNSTEPEPAADLYMVTPGYFDTMGIPRLVGRDFANEDPTTSKVAVVNEEFVRRVFGNENPIGRHVIGGGVTYQVIGVVKNIKSRTLGEEVSPVLYRSLAQNIGNDPSMMGYSLLVRTTGRSGAGDNAAVSSAVRQEIRTLDPTMAVFNAETMEEHLRDALFLPRLAGTLFGVFGSVGLLLAAVGLYGVMSYSVSRRTREIGIRLALGAEIGAVQRLVVRQGMVLTLIGVTLGLGGAWAVTKLFTSVLYGVRPHDLATFIVVTLFLGGVGLLACWIPSRRAAQVNPLSALRYE